MKLSGGDSLETRGYSVSSSTSSACSTSSDTSNEEEAEQGSSLDEGNDGADDEPPPRVEGSSSTRSGMENVIRHQGRGIEIDQQGNLQGSLLQNASMAELHQALRDYRHQQLSAGHADGQEGNRGTIPRRDNEHIRTTIQAIDQALEVVRSHQEENNTDDDDQEIGHSSSAFSSATSQDNRGTTSRRDNEHMRELIRTIDQALGVARTHQGEEEEEASADDDQEEGADAAAADDDV